MQNDVISLPSPGCSPLSLGPETIHHSSSDNSNDTVDTCSSAAPGAPFQQMKEISKEDPVSSDATVRSSSPDTEPSPTPKLLSSKFLGLLTAPDTSGSSEEFDTSVRKLPRAIAIDRLEQYPSQRQPVRRVEKPHLLPMCPLHRTAQYNIRVLKLTNLPWSITVDDLVRWLGKDVEQALISVSAQPVSVHILCDRY